jgi:integrase
MQGSAAMPPTQEHVMVAEAAERYLRHVEEVMERRPTTVTDYRIIVRRHI